MKIKNTLIGLGIFGAGFGAGYFVCKKLIVEQYKEDLDEVKEFYYNKLEEMGVMDGDFEPSDLIENIIEIDEEDEEEESWEDSQERDDREYFERVMKYSSAVRQDHEGKGKPIIKYNKPPLDIQDWGDLEEEEEELDDEEVRLQYEAELEARAEDYARIKHENQMNGRPYPISNLEYEDGPDEYDRRYLYYYTTDRVLCEDDDSIVDVDDIEELIGFEYEDILDVYTTCWVRNDNIMVMYEIHRVDESYKLTVEGAIETPREREFRLLGRRKQAMDDQ